MKVTNLNLVNTAGKNQSAKGDVNDKSFEDMINSKLNETSNTLPEKAENSKTPEKTVEDKETTKPEAKDEGVKPEFGENYVSQPQVQAINMQEVIINTVQPQVNAVDAIAQVVSVPQTQTTAMQSGEYVAQTANQNIGTNTHNAETSNVVAPIINDAQEAQVVLPIKTVDTQTNTANLNLNQTGTTANPQTQTLVQNSEQPQVQVVATNETVITETDTDSQNQQVVTTQIEVKPLDPNNVNIKVGDVQNVDTQVLTQDVADEITIKITENVKEFNIELNPEHLGKINIKIEFTPERAIVSLSCNNAQTQSLMAANAESIRQIIEANVGQETMVTVQENSETGQYRDNGDLQQESQNKGEQEQDKKTQTHDESIDFIQKLRLGLSDYVGA